MDIVEPILLTAEGINGKIELTETSLRITTYKTKLSFGLKHEWDQSKIKKIDIIPRAGININSVNIVKGGAFAIGLILIKFDQAHASNFLELAEILKPEAVKLEKTKKMAWYQDTTKLTHIATYDNEKKATEEAELAAHEGWIPQGVTSTDGHMNVGRTVAGVVFTGGLTLLAGGSRSKGKITITYTRSSEWLAAHIRHLSVSLFFFWRYPSCVATSGLFSFLGHISTRPTASFRANRSLDAAFLCNLILAAKLHKKWRKRESERRGYLDSKSRSLLPQG